MEKYLKDIIEKQNEKIEEIRDVMLWRTNKFKTMVVEWEIANEKVKAMDNHLTNYILDSDKAHGKSIERRDTKIEEQAKRIKELEKINDELPCPERMKALEIRNKDLKNAAKLYQKELVKAEKRIKELEERVGRIDELTNEVYGEAPDHPARFTLNNVVYFEDAAGYFMIANDGATDFTVTITHQEYIDSLNQYLKQEDPRDYPEDPSYE